MLSLDSGKGLPLLQVGILIVLIMSQERIITSRLIIHVLSWEPISTKAERAQPATGMGSPE